MTEGKRPVIIYGGSFDPPHLGHTALAAAALRRLAPSRLYFVPGFQTPFKDLRPVPFSDRAAMLRAAISASPLAGRTEVRISPFEAGLGRVVYTWETVAHFRRLHPGAPLYVLMGSDCLSDFRSWRRPDFILRNAGLLVGVRPGYSVKKGTEAFTALPGRFPEAASSDIRASLFLGEKPPCVAPAVARLIHGRKLYLGRERALLKRMLKPSRYEHTLQTARLALELAASAGVPAQQAALAALLHDCARDLPPSSLKRLAAGPAEAVLKETAAKAPVLLHAWAGAAVARSRFGVKDSGVLEAVALHATGGPGMGPLARLVYLSDLANTGRTFREAAMVRRLASEDFDAAFRAANYVKLVYAFSGDGWVHPLSVSLWNSLQEKKSV